MSTIDQSRLLQMRSSILNQNQALQRALSDLPDALKAPLLLAALEGRSHAEIAAILRPANWKDTVARSRAR